MKNGKRTFANGPAAPYNFNDYSVDRLRPTAGPGSLVKSPLAPQDVRITDRPDITPQEINVSLLVAQGKTNSEIAATLFLTPGTVRNYVSSILSKLYLPNRAALAVYVVQHDLTTPTADRSNIPDPDCYKDLAYMAYV